EQLIQFGFQVLVLMAGHYPWQSILNQQLPQLEAKYPNVFFLAGTEANIGEESIKIGGDHAAKEETAYGLALFPEFVDQSTLRSGRDQTVWPNNAPPPADRRHPGVEFDSNEPMFAQMGEPADQATAAHGEQALTQIVDYLVIQINNVLL
ncbi:MAG: creatininase family protein, partial [Dehalococcoidia bacterium]|nr:creatininase family protein [Dehalococcoidia bacterium]